MKKILKWAAALALLTVLVCCSTALAARSGTDGNITWSLSDDGVLTISGNGAMKDYSYKYLNGSYITNAPWGTTAKQVLITDGVTSIGNYAFRGCSNLTSITISGSVTSIGERAFYGCSSLTSITMPDSGTSIGNSAFSGCSSLTNITIPNGVTSIGNSAFYDCRSLTSITIPDSVISIGSNAFYYCRSLTSITIPDSVTSIGYAAFEDCSSLTSITIPNGVTSIGGSAFRGCTGLTSITIPGSVTSIGDYAFLGCSSLTSIAIPEGVTSIGGSAFSGCSGLTSIAIPEGVTSIGSDAFYKCSGVTNIHIDSLASWLSINYANYGSHPNSYSSNCHFYIDDEELTSITIPDSVTSIGRFAFYGCSSLTSITIPDSVTNIGDYAFMNCSSLTSITIPDSVISVGDVAFYGCSSLTDIHIDSLASWLTINYADYDSQPNYYCKNCHLYIDDVELTSITIPDSVTNIGDYAFMNCSSLTSITISDSVTSIGDYAFRNCRSLTSITIPDSVTSIGSDAFNNCRNLTDILIDSLASWLTINYANKYSHPNYDDTHKNCHLYIDDVELKSITIPDGFTNIGEYAFQGCIDLTSVIIPDSVTSIGDLAFYDCKNLTSITIPDSVTSIGQLAFNNCSSLTSITIPKGVTHIDYSTFYGCTGLTSVTISEGVTFIGWQAFYGCSNLRNITIPDSVTSIGKDAFYGCNSLITIWWPVLEEVTINSTAFQYKWNTTIYCYEFSPLETIAKNAGFRVSLIDDFDTQNDIEITVPDSLQLYAGITKQLSCGIFPLLPDVTIHYSCDNTTVGTVTDGGLFTAVTPGTAHITVTANNVSKTFAVTVIKPPVLAQTLVLADVWVVAKTTCQPNMTFTPADADVSLTWNTGSTTYATVDASGVVTGKAVGTTTLTVTDSITGLSATATVHSCYPVTTVAFTAQEASVAAGFTLPLTAQVTMRTQSCENHLVTFTSSNESIATVDANGVVHGVSVGTVQITATAVNDSSIAASITVTVREPKTLTVPASLTAIESLAFADLPAVEIIVIPAKVTFIAEDAFAGTDAVLSVAVGTYAADWAEAHGVPYVIR